MNPRSANFLLAGTTVVAVCALLQGGPLNPPTGPISSGGKTTQEIYDAVTGISGAIGSAGGRTVAVPGTSFNGGTFTMSTPTPVSGPIIGVRHSIARSVSGGTISGPLNLISMTIVREMGIGSATMLQTISNNQAASATISIPSAGGATFFALTNIRISGLRHYHIQRADGTFAAIEEIDLLMGQVQITQPGGTAFNHNYGVAP